MDLRSTETEDRVASFLDWRDRFLLGPNLGSLGFRMNLWFLRLTVLANVVYLLQRPPVSWSELSRPPSLS